MTGARDCPPKNRREVKISNEIISRTLAILRAVFDAGSECGLENPVDAGDKDRPEHLVNCDHAPLWLMPEVISFKSYANCREVSFPQCAFGAAFKKMSTFLLMPALGHILGDLDSLRCTHTHHEQRAGGERDAHGVWNSKAAAAYPPDLNWTLAGAINALVDDPEARSEQRFRQIRAPATEVLHASHAAVRPSPPPADPPTQPPPRNAPNKPSSVDATTAEPLSQSALTEATPTTIEATEHICNRPRSQICQAPVLAPKPRTSHPWARR